MSNNIKQTEAELITEILMIQKKILIVEGMTDKLFFDTIQIESNVKYQIYPMSSVQTNNCRKSVIDIIQELNTKQLKQSFYGIIDTDDDKINNTSNNTSNLYTYFESRDLENMLIHNHKFQVVLKVIRNLVDTDIHDIRENGYRKTLILGIIRYISKTLNLSYNFEGISYKKILEKKTDEDIIQYILSFLSLKKEQQDFLLKEVENIQKRNIISKFLCNGHDLLEMITCYINKLPHKDADYTSMQLMHAIFISFVKRLENDDLVQYCINEHIIAVSA